MEQIIFETSPAFVLLCAGAGGGYAFLLYRSNNPWNKGLNWLLFSLRAVLSFLIAFFLLGPIVRQVSRVYEKPVFVLLQDNSLSIKESTDSLTRENAIQSLEALRAALLENEYDVSVLNFSDEGWDDQYGVQATDINRSLHAVSDRYEGRRIAGVVLLSDGIYNSGLSPLYGNYNFPVYALGIGDTTPRADLMIKNLVYNKIAYEGNKFPIRAEVSSNGYTNEDVVITLRHKGKEIERQSRRVAQDGLVTFDFYPQADEQGIQRWDVWVDPKAGEQNVKNNRASVFIEVVEGRKKILVISPAPHPDIKALRAVIEQNSNFEFVLHIPGVEEADPDKLQPQEVDLVIFNQAPDMRGRTRELFQRFTRGRVPIFLIVGQSSDLSQIMQQKIPLSFEQLPRQFDEVTPVVNTSFGHFTISPEANSVFANFPPVQVHFGKVQISANASVLLFQKVGSLATDKPLLYVYQDDQRKGAVMLGEALWRWRLNEFSQAEKTISFDEVFGKLIQYLSTADDQSKFKSYPVKQQFSDTEPVLFESQVYNDIFEPIYGYTIDLELTDEQGKRTQYSYITSTGNNRYPIGGLKEGVYRYKSSTTINGKREEVRGQFMVVAQQLELQNLTADFDLLRKLAQHTGGSFFSMAQFDRLRQQLVTREAQSIIRSEERYDSLINLRWIFIVLLALAGTEWFFRKYFGSY